MHCEVLGAALLSQVEAAGGVASEYEAGGDSRNQIPWFEPLHPRALLHRLGDAAVCAAKSAFPIVVASVVLCRPK